MVLAGSLLCLASVAMAKEAAVTWISSTGDQPWQTMHAVALQAPSQEAPPHVRVASNRLFQQIDGFGGCFNELGWVALSKTSPEERSRVLKALFADDGCAFTMGRIPIGASDFALDGYSLDDTPGDLELKHFSIERDKKQLIPFIKAAMGVRPSLQCWGSPWSPPAWMKTNNNYSKGSLKWEPAILHSYATYLSKWVETYRTAGINVFALMPQNESNILSPYPSCLWTGEQLRDFIAEYLGPTLRDRKTNVELWLGTLNGDRSNNGNNINYRAVTVMENPKAASFITGLTFQYDDNNLIGSAHALFPEKKLMQSETECNGGANSWGDAERLYGLMKRYLENGAGSYFAWNMVLNETGMSNWNWKQNAMITVNQETGAVTLNGEYYVMRHFSQFVKPGAKRVLATGPYGDKIAFANSDGSTVLVMANTSKQAQSVVLSVAGSKDGGTIFPTLPPHSVNTFVFPGQ